MRILSLGSCFTAEKNVNAQHSPPLLSAAVTSGAGPGGKAAARGSRGLGAGPSGHTHSASPCAWRAAHRLRATPPVRPHNSSAGLVPVRLSFTDKKVKVQRLYKCPGSQGLRVRLELVVFNPVRHDPHPQSKGQGIARMVISTKAPSGIYRAMGWPSQRIRAR